jgi:serine/threonine protein phosphatase 1
MSDSHGAYAAMMQCLERCEYDVEKDQLYFLGDVVDGWSDTKESMDLLLCIKNLVYILGNHDQWALEFYSGEMEPDDQSFDLWLLNGGATTIKSYGAGKPMPEEHLELLKNAKPYHITEDNILLVHAGFDTGKPIEKTKPEYLRWSRTFIYHYYERYVAQKPIKLEQYKEVYIGHTPTISLNRTQITPLQLGNMMLIDTGAGFSGYLSIIDLDTKEVWQSDQVMQLYPSQEGRNGTSWNARKGRS